jgi:hypothetical protein
MMMMMMMMNKKTLPFAHISLYDSIIAIGETLLLVKEEDQ